MNILIFDTETGGISPEQNDVLQLSYQIIDYATQSVQKKVNHYFPWPDDKYRVCWQAIEVNGLTEEFLATQEMSERGEALEEFFNDMYECDYIVAHNGDFDRKFIDAEARRNGVLVAPNEWKPMIDTMKTTVEVCRLPSPSGRPGYKWPKLIELAECLRIETDDINLHDSSADVELTKRCFLHLLEKGFYKL